MLITVIAEKNFSDLRQKIQSIMQLTDAIELRLDYLEHMDISGVQQLRHDFPIPMIFTLRKKSQGGIFSLTEDQRLAMIEQLAQIEPEFIDLEYDVPVEFVTKLKIQHPEIQLIRSYHDFDKTPDNLAEILTSLYHEACSFYKIVTYAQSTLDCLRAMIFAHNLPSDIQATIFCMGELGIPTRILGPIVGNDLHYTCIDDEIAPGQLSLSNMLELYRFRSIDPNTKIYALLGDPVDKSAGHIIHNRVFEVMDKNAVYVKLKLKPLELNDFFKLIKTLPFHGFSVTMPLKQHVMPFLEQIDSMAHMINSVNTIVINQGNLIGYNTDGIGALDAIENKMPVANKRLVIIGAGATGRAIGHEAIKRHAQVIFINRTPQKAHDLAAEMNCSGYGFDEITHIKLIYDVLINTTPLGMSGQINMLPVPEDFLLPNRIVMDTVYHPTNTPLLKKAQSRNCTLVYGYEMFLIQAVEQLKLWFGLTS